MAGVHKLLESFKPIHGVLLCEGEDIDPSLYESEISSLSPQELDEIRKTHASDTAIDKEKDSIEFALAKLCLEQNIPYLGICRGSQVKYPCINSSPPLKREHSLKLGLRKTFLATERIYNGQIESQWVGLNLWL